MSDVITGTARRIRDARERLGRSPEEVSREVGMGLDAYEDIEAYDDEISTSISIGQLRSLANALDRRLDQLLGVAPSDPADSEISIDALLDRVRAELAKRKESVEEFGDRIGWDISSAVEAPASAWVDWNLDCLRDVCRAVSCDWVSVLSSYR